MVGFTRKLNSFRRSTVRKIGNRPKGVYHTVRRTTHHTVNNNSRKVKVMNNETRRRKKDKRKAKIWKAIVEEINDGYVSENIGLEIDDTGNLVGTDGEVEPGQYDQLIEELESRIELADDDYEEKVLNKAIKFVRKQRKAHFSHGEMNSMTE